MITIEKNVVNAKKSFKVGKYVNTEHVDAVIRNYKKERWVHNSEKLGKNDSLSAWYSVEELEDFLKTVKKNGADGVRMYFGVYDKDYAEKPEYAGRQTITLVATKRKESGVDKDIYIETPKGVQILAYNAGKLCPPFCRDFDGEDPGGIGIIIVDKGNEGMVVV